MTVTSSEQGRIPLVMSNRLQWRLGYGITHITLKLFDMNHRRRPKGCATGQGEREVRCRQRQNDGSAPLSRGEFSLDKQRILGRARISGCRHRLFSWPVVTCYDGLSRLTMGFRS